MYLNFCSCWSLCCASKFFSLYIGLTLLIPYLISLETNWSKNKLRVFTAGTKKGELDREQRQ